ncbi:MAG: amino acid permease [Gammaproteobacteria bacterium]
MSLSHSSHRSLGLWVLTALVAGNMIGSGVFLLPSSLAAYGTIGILAWTITAIGTIFLALTFARLARIFPKTGGPYAYCREAYGEFVGFQIAYNYWIAIWVGNAAIVTAFVGYLTVFWPALNRDPHLALWVSIGTVWFLTIVNIIGVGVAGRLQFVATVLKIIPLFIIATVGLFFVHKHNLQAFNVSGKSNWSALSTTATMTLWSFVGFESGTVPASHVVDPVRNIPRATIIGTIIAAAIYIASTTSIMGILPLSALAKSSSPYADAALIMFGSWGSKLVAIGALISCFGTLTGWILIQGQIPLGAAEDGLFPKQFARITQKGVPVFGLVVSSILISLLLIVRYGASLVDQFTFIILLATLASLIPYLYTSVAEVLIYVNNRQQFQTKRFLTSVGLATIGFVFAFWAIAGAGYQVVFYGLLLMLSAIPIYIWIKWRTPQVQEK